jgi:hypothetical protein
MTGEVRFGQRRQSRDAAWSIELVPRGRFDWMQIEVRDNVVEQSLQRADIAEQAGVAAMSLYDPLTSTSEFHVFCILNPSY